MRLVKVSTDEQYIHILNLKERIFDNECGAFCRTYHPNNHWWLAYVDGEPIGLTGVYICSEPQNEGSAFLCLSGVLSAHQGAGFQKRMIKKRLQFCKELNVTEVFSYTTYDNVKSMNSLISCGFKVMEPEDKWAGHDVVYWHKEI